VLISPIVGFKKFSHYSSEALPLSSSVSMKNTIRGWDKLLSWIDLMARKEDT